MTRRTIEFPNPTSYDVILREEAMNQDLPRNIVTGLDDGFAVAFTACGADLFAVAHGAVPVDLPDDPTEIDDTSPARDAELIEFWNMLE